MSVPGFGELRDEPDAPFYRSRERDFATPEKTAAEILRRFSAVVFNVIDAADRRPLTFELEGIVGWHRSVFASTFPHQAGVIRSGQAYFGIRWTEGGTARRRIAEGSEPAAIRDNVRSAVRTYNAAARTGQVRTLRESLTLAAALYAELLRIHPFEDGNLRAAFPALQGALVSLGAFPVYFPRAIAEHDEAIGWALRADAENRTIEPFVDLLESRTNRAMRRGRHDLP